VAEPQRAWLGQSFSLLRMIKGGARVGRMNERYCSRYRLKGALSGYPCASRVVIPFSVFS
jgi:hypothetical protein